MIQKIGFSKGLRIIRVLVDNLPEAYRQPFYDVLVDLDRNEKLFSSTCVQLKDALDDTRLEIIAMNFDLQATKEELQNEREK